MVVREAELSPVTPGERSRFERDGFLVVPGALSGIELAELVDAVDGVWDRRRAPGTNRNEPLHLLAFLGEDERFLQLLDHPATLPLVADVLGWNISVTTAISTSRRP